MTREELKTWAKENNTAHLVRELVEAGWNIDSALQYVYDIENLSKEAFTEKYFGYRNS